MNNPFTASNLKLIHEALPVPLGNGNDWAKAVLFDLDKQEDPRAVFTILGMFGAVGFRMERGAIPHRLKDLRCSYCFTCHDPTPLLCSRCRRVFYCNKDCQKSHWKYHKKVCGTVTKEWNLEGEETLEGS